MMRELLAFVPMITLPLRSVPPVTCRSCTTIVFAVIVFDVTVFVVTVFDVTVLEVVDSLLLEPPPDVVTVSNTNFLRSALYTRVFPLARLVVSTSSSLSNLTSPPPPSPPQPL